MTTYVLVGSQADVEKIKSAVEHHESEEGGDPDWEGYTLKALGITNLEKRSIRGFIRDKDYIGPIGDGDAQLNLYAEEAWSRTEFAELLGEKFPDVDVWWMAEETGMGIYQTNDSEGGFFPERYFVDTCIDGEYESEYFCDEQAAYAWIAEHSGCKNAEEVKAWNDARDEAGTEDFIYVHEFDVV